MNTPPDNDFSELRRLLSLKRHEQPPPGYFDALAKTVIASLKAEQMAETHAEHADGMPPWVFQLLERLRMRPAFAGALGAGMCALVMGGILFYQPHGQAPEAVPSLLSEITPAEQPEPLVEPFPAAFQPVAADAVTPLMASNTLQSPHGPTLFDTFPVLDTATVGHGP